MYCTMVAKSDGNSLEKAVFGLMPPFLRGVSAGSFQLSLFHVASLCSLV